MCNTCGCSSFGLEDQPGHEHDHDHHHHHGHHHDHPSSRRTLSLAERLLEKNDLLAQRNRQWLRARRAVAINFVSSPGSGKTTLLERTILDRSAERPIVVIQGDQATDRDAERIRRRGARAVQINTGTGCHLDADMVEKALAELAPAPGTLVAIENVGNLVCPALFDLGEQARVAILSVTEGGDKPLKYPYMFRDASLVVLNKIDLLPYVDFDLEFFAKSLAKVKPGLEHLSVSATQGQGLYDFYAWLARVEDFHLNAAPHDMVSHER
jgi:hydrogenase nickel incorporation protein HypB